MASTISLLAPDSPILFFPIFACSNLSTFLFKSKLKRFKRIFLFLQTKTLPPNNLDCLFANDFVNCGQGPGRERDGIPRPAICSVAVPALDKPTSAILAHELNLPFPITTY